MKIQEWVRGGSQTKKTMADSRFRVTPKTKNGEKSNWIPRKGRHKNAEKRDLSKSLKFIKPLRLPDEVDISL